MIVDAEERGEVGEESAQQVNGYLAVFDVSQAPPEQVGVSIDECVRHLPLLLQTVDDQ